MKSSEKTLLEHSKFLSLVLRHQPETIAIQLEYEGWTDVHILLQQMIKHKRPLKLGELIEIVESSDKKRFQLAADQSNIRAVQG
ncbi:RNA 2'-phosphotransferase, partial [Acinetobacter guillouiae]|uniref:RNA 2'-phosphotransferase n=1 Tax=Acinetobacter guillouiae TaxID=106649 RepID=UPI003AF60B94